MFQWQLRDVRVLSRAFLPQVGDGKRLLRRWTCRTRQARGWNSRCSSGGGRGRAHGIRSFGGRGMRGGADAAEERPEGEARH